MYHYSNILLNYYMIILYASVITSVYHDNIIMIPSSYILVLLYYDIIFHY